MSGHGSKPLRGLENTAQSSIKTGKFGRLFRWLPPALAPTNSDEDKEVVTLLQSLAGLMVSTEFNDRVDKEGKPTPDVDLNTPEEEDENRRIPAGYTYLGQFIDHDVTFDPASSLQQQNDPDALEDFRTPRLDLDSLYGRGPDDQPYLYQGAERMKMRLGPDRGIGGMYRPDLLRSDDGTALIGDKRNDENKIVRQIHALFLSFHNRVFDDLGPRFPRSRDQSARFGEAQRIVRWCYQWIVLRDFLPRICRPDIVARILPAPGSRGPNLVFYQPHSGGAYIPVEFSVAAYRFGHSMVRPSYSLNDVTTTGRVPFASKGGKTVPFARIPIFVANSDNARAALNGSGQPLPDQWGIDWSFFFGAIPPAEPNTKQVPQPSYRIDTMLVDPLGALPEFAAAVGAGSPFASLAFRNLVRAFRMGLPAGQSVARTMGCDPLSEEQLWQVRGKGDDVVEWPEGKALLAANRRWLEGRAPLWFYILKEAEIREKGHRLGEVGSQIVAETLIGLTWSDHFSYLFLAPNWHPGMEGLGGLGRGLDMLELTKYVG